MGRRTCDLLFICKVQGGAVRPAGAAVPSFSCTEPDEGDRALRGAVFPGLYVGAGLAPPVISQVYGVPQGRAPDSTVHWIGPVEGSSPHPSRHGARYLPPRGEGF